MCFGDTICSRLSLLKGGRNPDEKSLGEVYFQDIALKGIMLLPFRG